MQSVGDMTLNNLDDEASVMSELWGMQSTPSLPSHPDLLWPGVGEPCKGPMYGSNRTV